MACRRLRRSSDFKTVSRALNLFSAVSNSARRSRSNLFIRNHLGPILPQGAIVFAFDSRLLTHAIYPFRRGSVLLDGRNSRIQPRQ